MWLLIFLILSLFSKWIIFVLFSKETLHFWREMVAFVHYLLEIIKLLLINACFFFVSLFLNIFLTLKVFYRSIWWLQIKIDTKTMWHQQRKEEKRIKGLMVDKRRRAERRRNYYEQIKMDPNQFLQVPISIESNGHFRRKLSLLTIFLFHRST